MANSRKLLLIIILALLIISFGVTGFIIYRSLNKLPLPKPSTPADKLAEFHLVGGFAGYCDHLVVYRDENASLLNSCSKKQKDFQVDIGMFSQLIELSNIIGQFSYQSGGPDGPDSLYAKLIFYGRGVNQPNQKQQEAIRKLLNTIGIQGRLN